MKTLFAAVLVAGTLAGFSAADAAGGCGPGFHRGPYGGCRPNGGAVVVAPAAPRRGRACPGRGGAARPRLPLRLRLACRTLPPDLRLKPSFRGAANAAARKSTAKTYQKRRRQ